MTTSQTLGKDKIESPSSSGSSPIKEVETLSLPEHQTEISLPMQIGIVGIPEFSPDAIKETISIPVRGPPAQLMTYDLKLNTSLLDSPPLSSPLTFTALTKPQLTKLSQKQLIDRLVDSHGTIVELRELVSIDPLTGLFNRRAFWEVYLEELNHATRHIGRRLQLVMLDIDHFKAVNDIFGHQAGDNVLATFATLMKEYSRASDVVARYGGEEFIGVISVNGSDVNSISAEKFIDRFRRGLKDWEFDILNRDIQTSINKAINNVDDFATQEKIKSAIIHQLSLQDIQGLPRTISVQGLPSDLEAKTLKQLQSEGYIDQLNKWVITFSAGIVSYKNEMSGQSVQNVDKLANQLLSIADKYALYEAKLNRDTTAIKMVGSNSELLRAQDADSIKIQISPPDNIIQPLSSLSEESLIELSKEQLIDEILKRQEVMTKLNRLASVDPLTHLLNRRGFWPLYLKELSSVTRHTGRRLEVVMKDIDHFKAINDIFGHQAGDDVLQTFAFLLENTSRPSDIFARYGGEEFIGVVPVDGPAAIGAEMLLDRFKTKLKDWKFNILNRDIQANINGAVREVKDAGTKEKIRSAIVQQLLLQNEVLDIKLKENREGPLPSKEILDTMPLSGLERYYKYLTKWVVTFSAGVASYTHDIDPASDYFRQEEFIKEEADSAQYENYKIMSPAQLRNLASGEKIVTDVDKLSEQLLTVADKQALYEAKRSRDATVVKKVNPLTLPQFITPSSTTSSPLSQAKAEMRSDLASITSSPMLQPKGLFGLGLMITMFGLASPSLAEVVIGHNPLLEKSTGESLGNWIQLSTIPKHFYPSDIAVGDIYEGRVVENVTPDFVVARYQIRHPDNKLTQTHAALLDSLKNESMVLRELKKFAVPTYITFSKGTVGAAETMVSEDRSFTEILLNTDLLEESPYSNLPIEQAILSISTHEGTHAYLLAKGWPHGSDQELIAYSMQMIEGFDRDWVKYDDGQFTPFGLSVSTGVFNNLSYHRTLIFPTLRISTKDL